MKISAFTVYTCMQYIQYMKVCDIIGCAFSAQLGCDGQLGTEIYTDTCNVICGNNSTCQNSSRAIPTSELSYTWHTSEWSACSSLCGNGQESRNVSCTSQDGSSVEETHCDAANKPANTQVCLIESCDNFQWLAGNWSQVRHENALVECFCFPKKMQINLACDKL